MEVHVYVFWLLEAGEDLAYNQMNCQTCDLVSLWDDSSPMTTLHERPREKTYPNLVNVQKKER